MISERTSSAGVIPIFEIRPLKASEYKSKQKTEALFKLPSIISQPDLFDSPSVILEKQEKAKLQKELNCIRCIKSNRFSGQYDEFNLQYRFEFP